MTLANATEQRRSLAFGSASPPDFNDNNNHNNHDAYLGAGAVKERTYLGA